MEGNHYNAYSSYGTSWADQWDYNDSAPPATTDKKKKSSGSGSSSSSSSNYKQKVGDGLEKTKAVASTGMKKVKQGTSQGFQWIKDKYHKTTQKH